MSKRANEIAKELGIPNNDLVALINERFPELGVKSHSNTVSELYLDVVLEYVNKRLAERTPAEAAEAEAPQPKPAANDSPKRRVNEIAKELGLSNSELIAAVSEKYPELGVKSHSNSIPGERLQEITDYLRKKFNIKAPAPVAVAPAAPATPVAPAKPAPVPAHGSKVPPPVPAAVTVKAPAPLTAPKTPAPLPSPAKLPPPAPALPVTAKAKVPPPTPVPAVTAKAPAPLSAPKAPAPLPSPAKLPPPTRLPIPAKLPPPTPALPVSTGAKAPPPVPAAVTVKAPAPLTAPKAPAPLPSPAKLPPPVKLPPPAPKLPPAAVVSTPTANAPSRPPLPPRPPHGAKPPSHPPALPRVGSPGAPPPIIRRTSPGAPPALPSVAPTADAQEAAAVAAAIPVLVEEMPTLTIRPPIVVRDFAIVLNLRPFRLISELMEMGIFASIAQSIDESVAVRIAKKHGILLDVRHRGEAASQPKPEPEKPKQDDPALLKPRPPVVCVLGHVDHGKTTLLDFFRKTSVVSGEAGGITQHVGAYTVEHNGKRITFLDTPGHAAFSKMRERGAEITDIAILVVAADDGFMPQTDEALKFAQKNNVQIVVAVNKMDAKGANLDRVKTQMQQRGIASEDWGGTVLTTPVSALVGTGMPELLEAVLLQAEVMDLKANPQCHAEGTVVEAQMETGRGPTASIIVQKGTLKPGDALVCGRHYCKVRALFDDHGKPLKTIPPGNPALVLGWSGVPTPGAIFQVCKNERTARELAEENQFNLRKALEEEADIVRAEKVGKLNKLSDMDRLMAAIAQTKDKVFKVLCKADVNGTLEALIGCLEGIVSSKVKLEVVASSVGPITPNDVNVAHAAEATIVAFDVKQENGVGALLKRTGTHVITHDIIYMLIDLVKEAMSGLLDPEYRENKVGMAEVRVIFPHGKNSFAAGCMITEGRVQRDFKARLHRGKQIAHDSTIDTLKRFKDDVTEVKAGYECGIRLDGYEDYQIGDLIECYEILEERPAL